jgi:lipopolysaccharide biosynthesis regulator YciM
LGVLYRDAGVLDEAEAEFAALATANPSSEEARQLLENVRAVRRLGVP